MLKRKTTKSLEAVHTHTHTHTHTNTLDKMIGGDEYVAHN